MDETDTGAVYDPITTSYFYCYTPSTDPKATGTFVAYNGQDPTGFLRFKGRWGDAEYPADDPRQKGKNLLGFKKFVGGPTGVAEKQLDRKEVWPENEKSKGQWIKTSIDGSSWWKDLLGKIKGKMKGNGKKVRRVNVRGEGVK